MNESGKHIDSSKVYLGHAREPEQLHDMEEIAERGICFMCPEHIPEFYEEREGLIKEGDYSFLVHNGYPYENTEHHIMAIPKEHVSALNDISEEFLLEAFGYFRQLEQDLGITGGAVAMRFGEPSETGATAHHIHIHFIVPGSELGPDDKPVKFRMSRRFNT